MNNQEFNSDDFILFLKYAFLAMILSDLGILDLSIKTLASPTITAMLPLMNILG